MFKTIRLARSMNLGGERKQSVVVVQGLAGPLSDVASLLDQIDALNIDRDLGFLNMNEV